MTKNKGILNGRAFLTPDEVKAIRIAYADGGTSYPKLAKRYGVSHQLIYQIVKRMVWKDV